MRYFKEMDKHDLCSRPLMEPLSPHIPVSRVRSSIQVDCFQSHLKDKAYKAAVLVFRALMPDPTLWKEVYIITNHYLHLHKVPI